jgi:hypothetical protein
MDPLYIILKNVDIGKLTAEVESRLRSGWQCAGGVSVCRMSSDNLIYAQALVKVPLQVQVQPGYTR